MVHKRKRTIIKSPGLTELPPLPLDAAGLTHDYRRYFAYSLGQNKYCYSVNYFYKALALTVRDRLMDRWKKTRYSYIESHCKRGYYLSLEFLMGRTLGNAMLNLGITDAATRGDAWARHQAGRSGRMPRSMPGSATAASGAWPPVFWTAAPPCSCRSWAMASAMNTACSASASWTAAR